LAFYLRARLAPPLRCRAAARFRRRAVPEKGIKGDCLSTFMLCSILLNPQLIIYSGNGNSRAGNSDITLFIKCSFF
jgi:hypothetical protein